MRLSTASRCGHESPRGCAAPARSPDRSAALSRGTHRVGKPPLPGGRHTAVKPGPHIPWIVADGVVEIPLCLLRFTGVEIGETAIEIGQQIRAVATNCFGIGAHGLERPAPLDGREPMPQLWPGIVIGDRRRISKVFGGNAKHSEVKPGDAAPQQQLGVVGLDGKPSRAEFDRALEIALPPCCDCLLQIRLGSIGSRGERGRARRR